MTRRGRWVAVTLVAALVVAVPLLGRLVPATAEPVGAAELLARVQGSADRSWSGYVETEGTVQLPDADRFSDVAALLGERTRLRAWHQDADHWRVDQLLVSGESDLVHDSGRTTTWDYERARVTTGTDPTVRLPRTADLLPPDLARRLLRGVDASQVERLPARRVAGTSGAGLRVTPAPGSSRIDHVDLWADPASGVALRVEVHTPGDGAPAFLTAFEDFSGERPRDTDVDLVPTPGTEVEATDVLDIADAADQYAPLRPPARVAGLDLGAGSDGAVGVYGQGLTQLVVIPLRPREAGALRDQLAVTPGVETTARGPVVGVGPLGVLVTGEPGDGGFVLAGTLSTATLTRAAGEVLTGYEYTGERR